MRLLLLPTAACLLLSACTPEAVLEPADFALVIEAEAHESNSLAARVMVSSEEVVRLQIEYQSEETGPQLTDWGAAGQEHSLTVLGLRAETNYTLTPVVETEAGELLRGDSVDFLTGPLPVGLPAIEVEGEGEGITFFGLRSSAGPGGGGEAVEGMPAYIGVDPEGAVVWYYGVDDTANDGDLKLLDDGTLLLFLQRELRIIEPDGHQIASFTTGAGVPRYHHDALRLPNGNWLLLGNEERELDVPGLGLSAASGDVIREYDSEGALVWSWSVFDHLDQTVFPSALSRSGRDEVVDWTHGNAIVWLEDEEAILLSLRHHHQVLKIDRSSGELVWRLGVDGDFALSNPELGWFYGQHAPEPQADGSLLIYDNGNERPEEEGGEASRAVRLMLDEEAMTATVVWEAWLPVYTASLGDADELGHGGALLCAGSADGGGQLHEVDAAGETVWQLTTDGQNIYRSTRLPAAALMPISSL